MDDALAALPDLMHQFITGAKPFNDALVDLADLAIAAMACDMAGLTLRDEHGRPHTEVFTEQLVEEIDQVQYDNDSGPCLDAARTQAVLRIDDTSTERRWPEFVAAAQGRGIHSTISFPVVVAGSGLGALNFYDRRRAHFEDTSAVLGRLFASQMAVVSSYWNKADQATGLAIALQSRAVIEQAKGVLMATMGCSADTAFEVLRQQSQAENRKLRDIAQEVVDRQQR